MHSCILNCTLRGAFGVNKMQTHKLHNKYISDKSTLELWADILRLDLKLLNFMWYLVYGKAFININKRTNKYKKV